MFSKWKGNWQVSEYSNGFTIFIYFKNELLMLSLWGCGF